MPSPSKVSTSRQKAQKKKEDADRSRPDDSRAKGRGGVRARPWIPNLSSWDGDLGLEKVDDKPRRMSYREQREVVGKLQGCVDGVDCAIYITLANVFWVGRHPSCDLVLDYPEVSNFHLRIYAVRTATDLSIVCVQDVSTNGFLYNDTLYSPSTSIDIGGRTFSHRSIVLRPGDLIQIPGVPTVWTYIHNTHHHIAETIRPIERPPPTSVLPLFPSRDPTDELTRGPWRIHNYPLGTGSYGVVHLASHSAGGLQVACKTIARAKSRGIRDALKKEVRVMMSLNHPNVLGILDMVEDEVQEGEDDETPVPGPGQKKAPPRYRPRMHLFLELVTGGDLFSYVEKYQMLTEDEVKWIAYQLIEGLSYIHGMNVVHRDIKPENILLYTSEAYPRIVIADFGMAITYDELLSTVPEHRHQEAERRLHNCGTTFYLPPERLRAILRRPVGQKGIGESLAGTGDARRRAMARNWFGEEAQLDIYAMGLTLFLCASGQHPYAVDQDADGDGEEEVPPAEREETVTPAGYHAHEAYHDHRGKKSWDMFRAATAVKEDKEAFRRAQKEAKQYLQVAMEFSNVPVERWPQANWRNYSSSAKDFLRRLLMPTPTNRPTWSKMLIHSWWRNDLEYAQLLHQKIVVQGRTRIPLFANPSASSEGFAPVSKPKITTYGKGKRPALVRKVQEPLFLSYSSQGSQPQSHEPIETVHTEPTVRNGFAGRGRKLSDAMDVDDPIDCSFESVSTPSTDTALENERRRKAPELDDLMRYGSTPRNLFPSPASGSQRANPRVANPFGRLKRGAIHRHPSRTYVQQRRESLMDRICEDTEDEDEGADGDVEMEVDDAGVTMSIDP